MDQHQNRHSNYTQMQVRNFAG